MPELYPITYHDKPVPPEAGLIRDTCLKLGICAIQSNPEVIAQIDAPVDDVEHLITNVPIGTVYAASHAGYAQQVGQLAAQDEQTALNLLASFDAVLAMEDECHDLVGLGDHLSAQISNERADLGLSQALHLDAQHTYHERTRFGRRIPSAYFGIASIGAIRYTVSFGREADVGGTRFVEGPVTKDEMRDKSQLMPRIRTYPAGSVVRFMAESGLHERSRLVRPRVFFTETKRRKSSSLLLLS